VTITALVINIDKIISYKNIASKTLNLNSLSITLFTTKYDIQNSTLCLHSWFLRFILIAEQTEIFFSLIICWLFVISQMEYCQIFHSVHSHTLIILQYSNQTHIINLLRIFMTRSLLHVSVRFTQSQEKGLIYVLAQNCQLFTRLLHRKC
jgi:hypothetical protein